MKKYDKVLTYRLPLGHNKGMNKGESLMTASEIHNWDLNIVPALREYMLQVNCEGDCRKVMNFLTDVFGIEQTPEIGERVYDEYEFIYGA